MKVQILGAAGHDRLETKSRTTGTMVRRTTRALWLVVGNIILSVLLVVLGVYTTTRTESLNVTGYIPGVILTLGSFLGLLGLCLEENRKQLLTAAIMFLSFGIITALLCLVIDGVCILLNMDMRPLRAERCQYYSSGNSYIYENFYTSVPCWNLNESCTMTVRSGTCYCCDLYDCANGGYLSNYYEFVGIQSCEDVFTLYILIWTLTVLNLVAFFTGILITAVLGSIKDLRSSLPVSEDSESPATSPTAPQLMDANTHTVHRLYPDASMYFSPAENTEASQNRPPSSSSSPPPHFTPMTNPLLFKVHGF
uniref:transmembrane protein 255B isoform X1 n=1 Tax=Solea senegalensis TaxID=28829 RepID=UPI001CD8FB64|nr:transmembrane protein 255B isoform X1 [Solea senegalensis]XP_043888654.1 transmembrane protein 255B isoform X1 [Solea senegalensis]